ncbi:MAG: DNA internalization-related competence protein ComEC/Rec2 [bacterium]
MNTKPALKVLLLFMLGLITGRYFDFPTPLFVALSIFPLFLAFTLWYHEKGNPELLNFCLATGLVLMGIVRYELSTGYVQQNHILNYTNIRKPVAISGIIVRYPERRVNKIILTVDTKEIFINRKVNPTQGKILVSIGNENSQFQYGDEIIIRGKLRQPRDKRNPGEFDYREYLLAQGIFGVVNLKGSRQVQKISTGNGSWMLRKLVYPVKLYLDDFIAKNLPAKEGALLRGLLIGERGEIPLELRKAFAKLGVIHILAVSGLHVGFIILIFMGVSGVFRVPYRARVFLTLFGLFFYAYLTNLKPPVVRASIMGGLLLLGTLLERKTDVINTLALAALFILILTPLELFQSGFQLSFTAVASIIYLYPKLRKLILIQRFQERSFIQYPVELLLVSMAAFLGTLPFTIIYFNRLPSFSLLANLLIIPLAFCGLASGIVAAVINLFTTMLAQLYLNAAWFFLHLLVKIVEWGSQVPLSNWEIYKLTPLLIIGYFIGLLLLANFNSKRVKRWLIIYTLVLANVFVGRLFTENNHKLKTVYFDVGQGDAALLTFPNGKHVLIDGGPRGLHYDAGKWVIAPYLKREGIDEIDAMILSHAETDHLGGFPYLLRNFEVHEVWDNGQAKNSKIYQEYLGLLDSLKIKRRILRAGNLLEEFDPVKIIVFHPTNDFLKQNSFSINDGSLVLKVSYGETDFLFLGDIEIPGERQIAKFGEMLESEVVKVGHHGSNTSSSPFLLNAIQPRYAVISVGEFNRFNHPHQQVLERLNLIRTQILRTDQNAAIILTTNGREIKRIHWK